MIINIFWAISREIVFTLLNIYDVIYQNVTYYTGGIQHWMAENLHLCIYSTAGGVLVNGKNIKEPLSSDLDDWYLQIWVVNNHAYI